MSDPLCGRRAVSNMSHRLCGRNETQNGRSDPYADGTGEKSSVHKCQNLAILDRTYTRFLYLSLFDCHMIRHVYIVRLRLHSGNKAAMNETETIEKDQGVMIMVSGEPYEGTHDRVSASAQKWITYPSSFVASRFAVAAIIFATAEPAISALEAFVSSVLFQRATNRCLCHLNVPIATALRRAMSTTNPTM
jgi:hypothetical protein